MKAFIVNRVGDFGFLLGIALIAFSVNSISFDDVLSQQSLSLFASQHIELLGQDVSIVTLICIFLFIGAMGKSAQFPLHVWLPDSMEGPTPISALIHAATMVTAGIFMVVRLSPLFELSNVALNFILTIGAITCFFSGLIGVFQTDIKRVIAYSTLSQLGYMTIALGLSCYPAALFHLVTHAFFKALLFLAAGSVIMGMHHEQDMRNMGGLYKFMPVTWIVSLLGTLSLVGFPFFSGFYSKDLIIEAAQFSTLPSASFAQWVVIASVFITSLYSFRLFFMVFHGKPKVYPKNHLPHESPMVVLIPLILLAIPSVVLGWFVFDFFTNTQNLDFVVINQVKHGAFFDAVHHLGDKLDLGLHGFVSLNFILFFLGLISAVLMVYFPVFFVENNKLVIGLKGFIASGYQIDALYKSVFIKGTTFLGRSFAKFGDGWLIEKSIISGFINLISNYSNKLLKVFHSGFVYHYVFSMLVALLLLSLFFVR
jgi:NADH-quinone oxidoreductase subunit L